MRLEEEREDAGEARRRDTSGVLGVDQTVTDSCFLDDYLCLSSNDRAQSKNDSWQRDQKHHMRINRGTFLLCTTRTRGMENFLPLLNN